MYHPEIRGYPERFEGVRQESQQVLDEEVRRIEGDGAGVSRSHLPMGRPDVEILELAEELDAGLIVSSGAAAWGVYVALLWVVSPTPWYATPIVPSW